MGKFLGRFSCVRTFMLKTGNVCGSGSLSAHLLQDCFGKKNQICILADIPAFICN